MIPVDFFCIHGGKPQCLTNALIQNRFSMRPSLHKLIPHFFSCARIFLPMGERDIPATPRNDIPCAIAWLERSHLASGIWRVPSQIGLGFAKAGNHSPPRPITLAPNPPIPCFPRWRISCSELESEGVIVGTNRRWAWSNGTMEGGRLSESKASGFRR